MDIASEAESVRDALADSMGEDLYAVGWYDSDREPRTGAVYMNEEFTASVSADADEHDVLDDALLGRVGATTHDMLDEERVASTNVYGTFLDLHVHLDEYQGVVVAVARDRDVRLADVITTVQDAVSLDVDLPTAAFQD